MGGEFVTVEDLRTSSMVGSMRRRRSWLAGLASALLSGSTAAQEPAPPAPSPANAPVAASATSAQASCVPACRDGFTCQQQQCVSLCNPACPADLVCVDGRRCEPPSPAHAVSLEATPYEPPPPKVKPFDSRSHTLLGFHLGFAGDVDRDGRGDPLATTLGFNVRGDAPIARYVLLGPMLQLGAWQPDVTPDRSSNYYVDLDLVLRARLPITTATTNVQLWLGVPIGLTLDFLGDEIPNVSPLGFGWNVGVLAGGAVHFTPKFGLFAELGWLQHKISHEAELGQDRDFRLAQWNFNVGFAFRN